MADAWRMLEKSEIYVDGGCVPPRGKPGYFLEVQHRGHEKCRCLLSEPVPFWREHDYFLGAWPVDPLVAEEWKRRFLADHPEFVELSWWSGVSYGRLIKFRSGYFAAAFADRWDADRWDDEAFLAGR